MPHCETSWVPDERIFAGRENLDLDHAARYDAKEDAQASQELAGLLELGFIDESSTVVDLGAGTGQFVIEASAVARRVIAVDVSPVMLGRLEAKIDSLGITNVECTLAGFLTYVHKGPPANLVYSRYALHHLPDFWKALALSRIADFLSPGGKLRLWDVVYSFDPAKAGSRLEDWMTAAASPPGEQGWTRAELEEHVRDENSTFTWLLEPMLGKAGFTIERVEYSEDQVFARYICAKGGGPQAI